MKINSIKWFAMMFAIGVVSFSGSTDLANAQGRSDRQTRQADSGQRESRPQGQTHSSQNQSRGSDQQRRQAVVQQRPAQDQQRADQQRQARQPQNDQRGRDDNQRRQTEVRQQQPQVQQRVDQQRQARTQQDDQRRRNDDQQRQVQNQQRVDQQVQWRQRNDQRRPQERIDPQQQGRGSAAWQQREQGMWRQRQDQFRALDQQRDRFWQDRERGLEQQRRLAQWRFDQGYWNRLRQDRIRLQSFTYYDYGVPSYRYYREGRYFEVNQYGADLLRRAVNNGYEEGFRAGAADRQDNWSFDYQATDAFADATYGYDSYYVDLSEYQFYFREGFRRGYEDGYNGRYQYGAYSNGTYNILGDVMNLILDIRSS